jgi:hypothetical protein
VALTEKGLFRFEEQFCRPGIAAVDRRYASEPKYRAEVDTYGLEFQYRITAGAKFVVWAATIGFAGTFLRILSVYTSLWLIVALETLAYTICGCAFFWGTYRMSSAYVSWHRHKKKKP